MYPASQTLLIPKMEVEEPNALSIINLRTQADLVTLSHG